MRAVLARRHGPPESLVLEDLPALVAGPGEVVVAVHVALTSACVAKLALTCLVTPSSVMPAPSLIGLLIGPVIWTLMCRNPG